MSDASSRSFAHGSHVAGYCSGRSLPALRPAAVSSHGACDSLAGSRLSPAARRQALRPRGGSGGGGRAGHHVFGVGTACRATRSVSLAAPDAGDLAIGSCLTLLGGPVAGTSGVSVTRALGRGGCRPAPTGARTARRGGARRAP